MNEMFCGFEFIQAYINDLSMITKGYWYNHLVSGWGRKPDRGGLRSEVNGKGEVLRRETAGEGSMRRV